MIIMSNLAILPNHNHIHIGNVVDCFPQYVFWKDTNSRYLGCNDNFARLIGKKKEEVAGCADHDLDWGATGHTALNFRRDDIAVMGGDSVINKREILSLPDGAVITILLSKQAIIDDNQNVSGVIGCFSDISELIEAQRKAEAASKAKSEFIANMSHDLRTPMSGVVCMLECLMFEAEDAEKTTTSHNEVLRDLIEKIREYTTIAKDSSNELITFFGSILETVQLDEGNERAQLKSFDVRTLLQCSIDLLYPISIDKKLKLSLTVADDVPKYLYGLSCYLNQTLTNLIDNALKFTNEGDIQVSVDLGDNQCDADKPTDTVCVRICVSDTGIGIPKDKFDEIFERFTRLTPSYQGVYKRAGLGLYAVKHYVDAMGGDIKVKSELGKGCSVTVTVPFKEAGI